ncbi:LysR substrate-binding domain-containing protein [Variovorax paradoxus]|uniref:LysR substrate-binding domain-containing protein n=1 Tax=Variovorax paradoxus TaxID=34073 RepID=UPI001FD57DA7|nr:LysR substrate-binding domain-containing protein [Variovorax paradoxus]
MMPLFAESSTVIASPTLLAKDKPRRPVELLKTVLLSTETRPGDWEAWLGAAGCGDLRPLRQLRFDHFFVTLQAVVDGVGMGIGTFSTLSSDERLAASRASFPT